MKFKLLFLFIGLLFSIVSIAQIDESSLVTNIYKTVSVLADDSLKGREAGSAEEIIARDYIQDQFTNLELSPFFDESYIQRFKFLDGVSYQENAFFSIGGKIYKIDKNFYPLPSSSNGEYKGEVVNVGFGLVSEDKTVNDYKGLTSLEGKFFYMEAFVPGGIEEYSAHEAYANLDVKIDNAIKLGAAGIIFVNSDPSFTNPSKMISNSSARKNIPIVFLETEEMPVFEENKGINMKFKIRIEPINKVGYNVASIIDVGAKKSIVIGGHYDHLGMGGRTSRYRGDDPYVHNGADDNASGIAAIIEIARYYSSEEAREKLKYNLIFVAFSAEEKGLLGSDAFVNSKYFNPEQTIAMLNFDMVGRLSTEKPKLTLIGTGTAAEWDAMIDGVPHEEFEIAKSKSGIGGSDHTKFYLKKIPVLFFFTGIHDEYHMPEDDVELLNIEGEAKVIVYAIGLIDTINTKSSLTYKETKGQMTGRHGSKYKVTMGIMPGYGDSDVQGVKIDAVSADKPAQRAGLKAGDIIIQMGDFKIGNMEDYMKVLGRYNKGQKILVKYIRDGEEHETEVIF